MTTSCLHLEFSPEDATQTTMQKGKQLLLREPHLQAGRRRCRSPSPRNEAVLRDERAEAESAWVLQWATCTTGLLSKEKKNPKTTLSSCAMWLF